MRHQRLSDKELLRLNHVENLPSVVDLKNPLDSDKTVRREALLCCFGFSFDVAAVSCSKTISLVKS